MTPGMKRVLVLSFSPIASDPRVMRQVRALEGRYRLTVAGYGPRPAGDFDFHDVAVAPPTLAGKLAKAALLLAGLHRAHDRWLPQARQARAALAGARFDLVVANDLGALPDANIHKLTVLQLPVRSLYGEHWSTTGENVPDADAPDIDVYLPGRNVLLLGLTGVWCALNDVHEVAIGSLDDNPFPDATPAFFADYSKVLSASLSHEITISAPYRQRHKAAIIAEFPNLPLELTLTCMSPQLEGEALGENLVHCGACNKCNERQVAFRDAGVEDRTRYAI